VRVEFQSPLDLL